MSFYRQIIDSEKLSSFLTLPSALRDRRVEIIVLPLQYEPDAPTRNSSFGALQQYANPSLREEEKTAWEISVRERYEKR